MVVRHGRPYDPAWDLWRPIRRWPGVLVAAIVTVGLMLAIAYHFEHRVAQAKPAYSLPVNRHLHGTYFPPVTNLAGTQTFTGTHSRYAIPFTSQGHFSVWTFHCFCLNNFAAIVRTQSGKVADVPLNEIGGTRTTAPANYAAGGYTIDVIADGPWTINLIDETKLAPLPMPYSYASSGNSVLGPFTGASAHTLDYGYLAALGQLFTIQIVDQNGVSYGYKAFTLKSGGGSVALTGMPPKFSLIVKGAGIWLVSLKS